MRGLRCTFMARMDLNLVPNIPNFSDFTKQGLPINLFRAEILLKSSGVAYLTIGTRGGQIYTHIFVPLHFLIKRKKCPCLKRYCEWLRCFILYRNFNCYSKICSTHWFILLVRNFAIYRKQLLVRLIWWNPDKINEEHQDSMLTTSHLLL